MSFHLQSLQVQELRQFTQAFELPALQPGLNIVAGPNGAGKSSLARAIKAAFFERYKSSKFEDLLPFSLPSAQPQVTLSFTWEGEACRLEKSFGKRARCLLQVGHRLLEGQDAEDHLASLMGFSFAARAPSKPENQGVPGLLWIEQGHTQQVADVAQHAQGALHQALQNLQAQAGDSAAWSALAATQGDALLARLRAQRGELLTGTGRPRGPLEEAQQQLSALTAELAQARQRWQEQSRQVDALAALQAQQAQDHQRQPWLQAEQQAEQARQQLIVLAQRERECQQAQERLVHLEAQWRLRAEQLEAQAGQARQLAQRESAMAAALAALAPWEAQLARSQAQVAQAMSERDQAARLGEQARWQAALEEARERVAHHQARLEQVQARWQAGEAVRQERAALLPQIEALKPLAEAWPQWQALEQAIRDARLTLRGFGVQLQWQLPGGQQLSVSDRSGVRALGGQGECALTELSRIALPGGGELTLQPLHQEWHKLSTQLAHDEARLAQGLAAHGLADSEAAAAAVARLGALRQQLALADKALSLHAPKGWPQLEDERAQAQSALAQAGQRLAEVSQRVAAALEDQPAAQGPVPRLDLPQAEQALQAQEAALQSAREALAQHQQSQARAQAAADSARQEHEALRQSLDSEPARQQRAEAQAAHAALSLQREALQREVAQAQAQLQAARPDILRQDVDRLSRSASQMRQADLERAQQIQLMQDRLEQAGAQDIQGEVERLSGQLAQAQARLSALQLRAAALDDLCQRLDAARQARLQRLHAPLQRHLEPYVRLLWPQARLVLDDALVPAQLIRDRDGLAEPLDMQSYGTREQLGLISRLAYADLLREAGRPTLLILDDALVHTDAQRLVAMKRILFDAASRHQVLLFTCQPELWQDMGVAVARLPGA